MKRWPGIRHVRWMVWVWRAQRWARLWGMTGIGLGHIHPSDHAWLNAIWYGEV